MNGSSDPALRIDVVTIFPDYLSPLRLSLVGKALASGIIDLRVHDLRRWTHDRHRTVDDTPYGGGPGMVMSAQPWGDALDELVADDPAPDSSGEQDRRPSLIIPTPSGMPFTQRLAQRWARRPWLVLACGRYEGIDARVADHYADRPEWSGVEQVSIGDYVLAGGEAAALVMIEAVARLVPGVVGNPASVEQDSFAPGPMEQVVEGPAYTKPPRWRGLAVPEVLLSGNHGAIEAWRSEQAQERTRANRPDLAPAPRPGAANGALDDALDPAD